MRKNRWIFLLSFLMLCPLLGISQEVQPAEPAEQTVEESQQIPTSDEGVVELDVQEIQIQIEKPQVLLFSNRIKPEFDEVNLEKSFMPEIVGESERFVFDFSESKKPVERIDVNKLINQYR
jgi:hypothetical protein